MTDDIIAGTEAVAVSPAAKSQLGAIWDQWPRPLLDCSEELTCKSGRHQAERDATLAEMGRLRAAQGAAFAAPASNVWRRLRTGVRLAQCSGGSRGGADSPEGFGEEGGDLPGPGMARP